MAKKKRGALVEGADATTVAGKAGDAESSAGKQLTVRIPREMDFRLDSIARSEGLPKSAMAIKLLDQGLQRYGFDAELRQVWATLCRKAGEAA
jgi:predicted transcriptional regulator